MSIDNRPKHVVITGPTAGIGRASALSLARDGADLTFLCRNLEKGEALASEVFAAGGTKPTVIEMEMASLDSVRAAAETVRQLAKPIDVLLNNAGVINSRRRVTSMDLKRHWQSITSRHFF